MRVAGARLRSAPALSAGQYELSEQAVCLVIWPGSEDQLVGLGRVPVAETQAPQAFDGDRVAVGPAELTQVRAGVRVVGVDVAIAEVADEQRSAEPAEVVRGQGEPPWRVQRAPGDQPADERAVVGEDVHESVARAGHVIFAAREPAAAQFGRLEVTVVDLYPPGPEVGGVQIGLAVRRLGLG